MTLRPASASDISIIHALAHRIWWEHYPDIIGREQVEYMLQLNYSEQALDQQMAQGQEFKIVELYGKPAGYIGLTKTGDGIYFLNKFYLDTVQHRKGFGTAVFNALIAAYPDLLELHLLVNKHNYKSINFYFKVGFIIEKCIVTPIGEGFVMDDFQMRWRRNA